MITTRLHNGQGLGNQLWTYVVTRVIAEDRGYDFGIEDREQFKGSGFMDLDFGDPIQGIRYRYEEKALIHPLNGADIRIHDDDLLKVEDDTELCGYMQDERYIAHRKNEIRKWLHVRPECDRRDLSDDDICIINFRGSGYVTEKALFLSPRYWRDAMRNMLSVNGKMRFVVITEDVATAKTFFPDLPIHHFDIGGDYAVIKNAKYLILSNSSFAWFPAWLSTDLKCCIAPKYWARHNVSDGFWCLGYNITSDWIYQDRRGSLQDYDSCLDESRRYEAHNAELYSGHARFETGFNTGCKESLRIFQTLRKESSAFQALKDMAGMSFRRTSIRLRKLSNGDMLH